MDSALHLVADDVLVQVTSIDSQWCVEASAMQARLLYFQVGLEDLHLPSKDSDLSSLVNHLQTLLSSTLQQLEHFLDICKTIQVLQSQAIIRSIDSITADVSGSGIAPQIGAWN